MNRKMWLESDILVEELHLELDLIGSEKLVFESRST